MVSRAGASWVTKAFGDVERADAATATRWVQASKLPAAQKKSLGAFVARCGAPSFARPTRRGLDGWAAARGLKLPAWAKAALLATPWVDGPAVELRLRAFSGWAPTSDEVKDSWYRLHFAGAATSEDRALLDTVDLFPFAEVWGTHHSYLAMDFASRKPAGVYEYALENLRDNVAEGKDAADSVYCVYDSLFELLDHVAEVRVARR